MEIFLNYTMNKTERIRAFVELGNFLSQFSSKDAKRAEHKLNSAYYDEFEALINRVSNENLWFTPLHVHASINGICTFLKEKELNEWLNRYSVSDKNTQIKVAVIMAGNIPMVGFHDMLSVLISGHSFIGKLSSKDNQLLNFVSKLLVEINSEFEELISFQSERLSGENKFDAIIATGSNNSARYFEAYFKKYDHIIRRNRNSVAVISGNETEEELEALGRDVFLYFGLGCRNVSKIYIPVGYNLVHLLDCWKNYSFVNDHNKYANNYDYQRSMFLMNRIEHLDTGFVLLNENTAITSPIGVVNYEYYSEINDLKINLNTNSELIQCIVGNEIPDAMPFGKAQEPELFDYADNVDTMEFLSQLKSK
ncbi:acyl-CoA reductase [Labilibaculum manganireducens]|uniref:acyl-CoA reductase n=1 Tax=Labilibaculum manganireducens TaxID=1940525 RepID=UPI0029F5A84A|nr:acyl-CoA reductase [Labilibaculum manganireducens]